jgi:hypothetical protein
VVRGRARAEPSGQHTPLDRELKPLETKLPRTKRLSTDRGARDAVTLVTPQCSARVPIASVSAQVAKHPGVLVLLAAIVLGQVLERLAQPHLLDSTTIGQLPLVPLSVLAAQLVLVLLILWFRVRLGNQVVAAARERALSLPEPASLPKQYVLADPAAHITAGALGILDIVLLLLVQSALRDPILTLTDHFLIPRTTAESAFVVVVELIAVLMLIKLYRAGAPVLVLLLWWGLDRVVPTAGFLGSRAAAVASAPTRSSRPLSAPVATPVEATVATPRSQPEEATVATAASRPEEATVAAATDQEATVLAEATVVATNRAGDDEATVLRPETP